MNTNCYKCCHFQNIIHWCLEMQCLIREENTNAGVCPFYVNMDGDYSEE